MVLTSPPSLSGPVRLVWLGGLSALFTDFRWSSFFLGILFAAMFILLWLGVTKITPIGEYISRIKRYTIRVRLPRRRSTKRHSSHRRPRRLGK